MRKSSRRCPYCDYQVSYFEALADISRGEHTCCNCNQNSNIIFGKKIYIPAAILLAIAVIVSVAVFLLSEKTNHLLTAVIIIIPFAVFFFLTPMYYNLYPINSAAITPVVKQKVKSKARSQITPRAVKYEEKKRLEKEKKIMDKRENSFKSKFSKFVKTYIIVDDEAEENSDSFTVDDDADSEKTKIVKAIKDDDLEKLKKEVVKKEEVSFSHMEIDTEDPLREEDSFSFVSVYTNTDAYEKIKEPVYHSLNKIKKVDFVYLPELEDVIRIDLDAVSEEDEENEEIMSFFDSQKDKKNEENGSERTEYTEISSYSKSKEITEKRKNKKSSVNSVGNDVMENGFSAEMINAEIDMAIEESVSSYKSKLSNTENDKADNFDSNRYVNNFDLDNENIEAEEVSENKQLKNEKNTDKTKSFQQELDLSEYQTSSYVEDESIDIALEYNSEEDQDEEFSFDDEQEAVFDESGDETFSNEDEINTEKETPDSDTEEISDETEPVTEKKGLFARLVDKFVFATEEEREEIYEQEERARKLEEKERRRREKEKEKLIKEKEEKRKNKYPDNDSLSSDSKKKN